MSGVFQDLRHGWRRWPAILARPSLAALSLGLIVAGNSLILLLAWRSDSLTTELVVSSAITSVIMAIVGVLACAAPARRALRIQPTEALRQG